MPIDAFYVGVRLWLLGFEPSDERSPRAMEKEGGTRPPGAPRRAVHQPLDVMTELPTLRGRHQLVEPPAVDPDQVLVVARLEVDQVRSP